MLFSNCTLFIGDIETDGPDMERNSMIWLGVFRLTESLGTKFEGKIRPKTNTWNSEALGVTGLSREETMMFERPEIAIPGFVEWVNSNTEPGKRALFCSDNNGYDWGWLNYYLWRYAEGNPFGHTSCNIRNLYQGLMAGRAAAGIKENHPHSSFEHLVMTPHDHNPVNDARGLAEALLGMRQYGLAIPV